MPKLLFALLVIGWLIAMAIAVTASSANVIYAYRYGVSLAASEAHPWLTGATLAIADIVKIGLPAIILALWRRSHHATARTLSVVFVMLLGLSLWSSTSITTIERAARDAEATSAAKIEADLRTELSAAESRIVELSSPPPLAAVEAEIDGFKTDARWRTTEACNPLHVYPSSRRFCEKAALKQAARAEAAEADQLRNRIAVIRQILTSPAPDAGKTASPELSVLSKVSGWPPESIGLGRAIFFAIALELLSAFVPSAVWFLRPSTSSNSELNRPSSIPKVADAFPERSPKAPSRGPVSPRPVRRRQRKAPRTHRQNGRSNLVSFAAAFAARHGRPPTTTEVKNEFPQTSTTTAWRAIKDATGGMGSRVHEKSQMA